jgi:hypothetical protein
MSAIQIVHDVLVANAAVFNVAGDRVGPLQSIQGQLPPYVVLRMASEDPQNILKGAPGITRCLVQVDSWANSYAEAEALSDLCKTAMQAVELLYMSLADNAFDDQRDLGTYSHGRIYQVWV